MPSDMSMGQDRDDQARLLDSFDEDSVDARLYGEHSTSKSTWSRKSILCALFCLTGVVCFAASILILVTERRSPAEMNQRLKDISSYSPVLDQLEIPLIETKSFGAFFDDVDHPSIYRQAPRPEVDAAWDDLEWIGRLYITDEEVIRLGKDPSQTVRSQRYPDKHLAIVSVFHELHCLNSLRKAINADYYFGGHRRTDAIYEAHIYHCIDTIRQSLMCSASVDVTTYNWVETQKYPYADLSKNQVCRDFDTIKRWQNDTMEDLNAEPVFRQGGEVELPRPKKLKQIHDSQRLDDA